MTEPSQPRREEPERVVIRDKRKLNPASSRDPASPRDPAGPGGRHHAEHKHAEQKPEPKRPKHAADDEPRTPGAPPRTPAAPRAHGSEGEPTRAAPGPTPGPGSGAGAGGLGAELDGLRAALEERTRDLQRVTAEYANYRKRVERDRALVGERATGNVLSALLPVLDDLDRARDHGELVEGVAAVAEQLVATTTKFGLTAFGEKGDPFDPTRHEAVAHLTSDEVAEPTCVDILRRGYLLGDRLLRPAMVAVAAPAEPS